MNSTINEIADHIESGGGGSIRLDMVGIRDLYREICRRDVSHSPTVTALRVDRVLFLQFTEYAPFLVFLDDPARTISRTDLEDFILGRLDFKDTEGERFGFFRFLTRELRQNWKAHVALFGVFVVIQLILGTRQGMVQFFNITSQLISIFVAVFVVFVTGMGSRWPGTLQGFIDGKTAVAYRIDTHMITLAVVVVFASLLGIMLPSSDETTLVTGVIGGRSIWFDPVGLLFSAISVFVLNGLLVLFLSLPQYYLERSKHFSFFRLTRRYLREKHDRYRSSRSCAAVDPGEQI